MKTWKSVLWGLFFIALGVILSLNALNIIDFDLFFDGWWTLFIIVPGVIGLFTDDNKSGSIICISLGVLLLLACQKIIDFDLVAKLIFPIIIIMIGLSLLFKNMFNKNINAAIGRINKTATTNQEEYTAVFSGQDIKLDKEEFTGTTLNAVFGGIDLDLRKATIKKDVVITAKAVFGGVDIYVPDNAIVQVKSNSVFGGVENKRDNPSKGVTIYIDATCVFGGLEIK